MDYTVLLSFKTSSQPDCLLFTDNVIHQTTTNPIFASLKPFVDPVVDSLLVFRTSFNLAKTGGAGLNIDRDKKHKEHLVPLTGLAKAVEKLANGDKAIIMASGFKPSNDSQALTGLLAPTNFMVFNLVPNGEIQLNWDIVMGRLNYTVEMRVFGEEAWRTIATPTARLITLTDFVRGSHLEFRVRASGTRNIVSPWSVIKDVYVD